MSGLSFDCGDGCDIEDCDCDDCDCDGCDCPDCDCDCCDCCKNFCDAVCFRCCAMVYNCIVYGISDCICCCFFQSTTTTTDSYHEYETHQTTFLPVAATSAPDRTARVVNGAKGPKERKGGPKDKDGQMSPEELEQRVMAGEEECQPLNEELQRTPGGDLDPTAPPIETEVVTLEVSDTNYPAVAPPSYDEVVTTQPHRSG